jgi:hypothetical protein
MPAKRSYRLGSSKTALISGFTRARSVTASSPATTARPAVGRAPGQQADRRGLARAVVAEQAEDLALGDAERDAVDGAHRAVPLFEARDLDHRLTAHARSG